MPEFFWKYRKAFTPILKTLIPVALAVFAIRVWRQGGYSDFIVYFQTSKRMLAGQWREIYQVSDHYSIQPNLLTFVLAVWPPTRGLVEAAILFAQSWGGCPRGLPHGSGAVRQT
jgi:hypothetical protein